MSKTEPEEYWYRYEHVTSAGVFDADGDFQIGGNMFVRVELHRHKILKHTPKGVWIKPRRYRAERKFICRTWRKRWACPTIEEARLSFIHRKKVQLSIYRERIEGLHAAIAIAEGKAHRWKGKIELGAKYGIIEKTEDPLTSKSLPLIGMENP